MLDTPTRTAETIQRYTKRAQQILAAIPAHLLADPNAGVSPTEAAVWLEQQANGLRKPTFRQYKASLICYFEQLSQQYPDGSGEYQNGIARLRSIPSTLAAGRTEIDHRTSSRKAKYVHIDDISTLGQYMLSNQSQWASRAFIWLVAGIVTGLRPAEWENVEFTRDAEQTTLQVANAKTTNGRGNGEFRKIAIDPGWPSEYAERHYQTLRAWIESGEEFEAYYDGCRLALNRAVRALWPNDTRRRYSLYSGRHQFCANLKRSGMSKESIAKLLGHGSAETATRHYGKKRSGHTGKGLVPALEKISVIPLRTQLKSTPSL